MGLAIRTVCGEDFSENIVRRWNRSEKPRCIAERFEQIHTEMYKKQHDPRLKFWEEAHFNRLNDAANNPQHFKPQTRLSVIVDNDLDQQDEENWMRFFVEEDPLLRSIFFFCVLDRSLDSNNFDPIKSICCLEQQVEPTGGTSKPNFLIYFSKNDPVRGPPFPPDNSSLPSNQEPETCACSAVKEKIGSFELGFRFVTNWSHMAIEESLTKVLISNCGHEILNYEIGLSNWLCLSSLGNEVLYV